MEQTALKWELIEKGKYYHNVVVRKGNDTTVYHTSTGGTLIAIGYTHYISAQDLLLLPLANPK